MKLKIYQPNLKAGDVAKNLALVDAFYALAADQYNLVYEVEAEKLPEPNVLCNMFLGMRAPTDFHGHPLTSGDVVVCVNASGKTDNYILFVDTMTALTATRIRPEDAAYMVLENFDAEKAFDARNYVTGVLCNRGQVAEPYLLSLREQDVCRLLDCRSYRVFQAPCRPEAAILCKDNAFTGQRALTDMNRTLHNDAGEAVVSVAGDFVICRMTRSGIQSLHPKECEDFAERHYLPESFFTFNGKLASMCYLPKGSKEV